MTNSELTNTVKNGNDDEIRKTFMGKTVHIKKTDGNTVTGVVTNFYQAHPYGLTNRSIVGLLLECENEISTELIENIEILKRP